MIQSRSSSLIGNNLSVQVYRRDDDDDGNARSTGVDLKRFASGDNSLVPLVVAADSSMSLCVSMCFVRRLLLPRLLVYSDRRHVSSAVLTRNVKNHIGTQSKKIESPFCTQTKQNKK